MFPLLVGYMCSTQLPDEIPRWCTYPKELRRGKGVTLIFLGNGFCQALSPDLHFEVLIYHSSNMASVHRPGASRRYPHGPQQSGLAHPRTIRYNLDGKEIKPAGCHVTGISLKDNSHRSRAVIRRSMQPVEVHALFRYPERPIPPIRKSHIYCPASSHVYQSSIRRIWRRA